MRKNRARGIGFCLAVICGATRLHAAQTIVDAPPREPEEEKAALHVPPGFEVQLVASEPDIHKPINIAFDDRGRLWVTDTVEYPFPAAEGASTRDTVKILEDFDEQTGKARKITAFADNLNIPVGILPAGDNAAIVYSIPGIWKMTDTTGAGHADRREVLLGGFGHADTHGMTGSFTEGFDGWIYAVHGFSNTSTIKAADGSQITMQSGNTYRFRRDGSHIEQFTHGQVNPFGMCFDPLGNLYTSDCETKPIALLLRESYHPSFGKPDDGLGFSPEMCDHMYGSTAIAGLCDYVAEQYPAEYRNRMLVGNVVTNRINAAKLTPRGSAYHADDSPDFVTSDDGWFRPTCIKLGPDGAMYVSDFYNRIIGHYEVDLHHPGRDKQRGRIWRIVYKGPDAAPAPAKHFDLTHESVPELVADLASPNLTVRMLATNRLADVIGPEAVAPLKDCLAGKPRQPTSVQKVHVLWALHRLGALDAPQLHSAAVDDDPIVREHAMRIVGEMPKPDVAQQDLLVAALTDADPLVRRTAVEAMARHPRIENLRPLLDLRQVAGIDPYLLYAVRITLRDHFLDGAVGPQISGLSLRDLDRKALADVAVAASPPGAAGFLLDYLQTASEPQATVARYLQSIARSVPEDHVDALAKLVLSRFPDDPQVQLAAFKSIVEGLSQRGLKPTQPLREWGTSLATRMLAEDADPAATWTYSTPKTSINAWTVQVRASADGDRASPFLSSLVNGETLTGIARSRTFAVPARLTFYMAGHNGLPPKQWPIKNIVRLRDAKTNEILMEQAPPRNDVAQKVTWDLEKFAGREGYIEATDGDSGKMYAWLAFGRFDPPVVRVPAAGTDLVTAVGIVETLHLVSLADRVEQIARSGSVDSASRTAAARALGRLDAAGRAGALASIVQDVSAPDAVREAAAGSLGSAGSPAASAALVESMRSAPMRLQLSFAKALAAGADGAAALLDAIEQGKASPRLLQDSNVRERLSVARPANLDERLKQLTQGMPAADAEIQKLIDQRAARFDPKHASAERGKVVFQKNCMACHTVGGQGARVGPQLDGIGARGVPRLCEDILDPSRNVDVAFRYSTFVLDDGNVIAGIPRHEEGAVLTVADSTGKEVAIPKARITRRVESRLSLMPGNFGEVIPPADFEDLLSYLLSTKQ